MHRVSRLIVGAALVSVAPSLAHAQAVPASQVIGGTTITLGGGLQQLALPDMNFTFKTDTDGAAVERQTNGTLDNVGGAFAGSIETPFAYWGGTPVTGVASGFFANVDNSTRRKCISSQDLECEADNIIDNPEQLDSFGFNQFKTNTDRNVRLTGDGFSVNSLKYNESLDTATLSRCIPPPAEHRARGCSGCHARLQRAAEIAVRAS
jgi:hypothetical protein